MIISSLENIQNLPKPALGLLPAIHDVDFDGINYIAEQELVLPSLADAKGKVFKNVSENVITLPASGNWPQSKVDIGGFFGCDGRLFYQVVNKKGTISYYPKSFERNLYTLAHDPFSFPKGSIIDFTRLIYMRMIGNNTTAVWSVIFECGIKTEQQSPSVQFQVNASVQFGSDIVSVDNFDLINLSPMMQASGDGVQSGLNYKTLIKSINVADKKIVLTRPILASGQKTLTFSKPPGPNLGDIEWLPPMLDQQLHVTEILTRNSFGARLQLLDAVGEETNSLGFYGTVYAYGRQWGVPIESLPTSNYFVFRVRLGDFDTENSVLDPRGFIGYLSQPVPTG